MDHANKRTAIILLTVAFTACVLAAGIVSFVASIKKQDVRQYSNTGRLNITVSKCEMNDSENPLELDVRLSGGSGHGSRATFSNWTKRHEIEGNVWAASFGTVNRTDSITLQLQDALNEGKECEVTFSPDLLLRMNWLDQALDFDLYRGHWLDCNVRMVISWTPYEIIVLH